MLKYLVILLWLSLPALVVYRLRATEQVSGFFAGFKFVWYSVATLTDQEDRYAEHRHKEGWEQGVFAGAISGLVALVVVLVFAGFTIYWAW